MLKYANAEMGGNDVPGPLEKAMQLTQVITFDNGNMKVGLGWLAVVLLSNCGLGVDDEGAKLMAWLQKN